MTDIIQPAVPHRERHGSVEVMHARHSRAEFSLRQEGERSVAGGLHADGAADDGHSHCQKDASAARHCDEGRKEVRGLK